MTDQEANSKGLGNQVGSTSDKLLPTQHTERSKYDEGRAQEWLRIEVEVNATCK